MRDHNMLVSILLAALLLMIPDNRCYGSLVKYCPGDQANFEAAVDRVLLAWQQTQDCRDNQLFERLRYALNPGGHLVIVRCWNAKFAKTEVEDASAAQRGGSDSTVFWNSSWIGIDNKCPSQVTAAPDIVLIHELAHAAQAALGILPNCRRPPQSGSVDLCEQRGGAYIENMYRRAHNLPMRKCYGGEKLDLAAVLPCCQSGQVACGDKCCDGNALCSVVTRTCSCTIGTQACVTACCAPSDSCSTYTDAVLPSPINAGGFCCSPGHFGCVFRPGGANSGNLLSTVCCTNGQGCQGNPPPGQPGGCVSP